MIIVRRVGFGDKPDDHHIYEWPAQRIRRWSPRPDGAPSPDDLHGLRLRFSVPVWRSHPVPGMVGGAEVSEFRSMLRLIGLGPASTSSARKAAVVAVFRK
jgi:hypothetical protein